MIGAGYTSCKDISFKAVDLFKTIDAEIRELNQESPIVAQVHPRIMNLRHFAETFLFHMSHGINAEFISQTSEVFLMLHDRLYSNKVKLAEEIGGHSAFWIQRA